MRKFKADNPKQDHENFDRLLSEIFPQEVPVRFVTSIKVIYKDGTEKAFEQVQISIWKGW